MKRLILTALSFAMVVAAKADIIRGYVVDADTGRHWLPPVCERLQRGNNG